MEYTKLLVEVNDGIAKITFNNPKTLNALSSTVVRELYEALGEIEDRDDVRVLVLTGIDKTFISGGDIAEMSDMDRRATNKFLFQGFHTLTRLENMSVPTIAAINGYCFGGGLETAMACDIRVGSTKASFGLPEVGLGIIPGFGGTQRLPRLIGEGNAKYLGVTAKRFKGDRAYELGILQELTEPEDLMDKVNEICEEIKANAPIAVGYVKDSIHRGMQMDIESGLMYEMQLSRQVFQSEDRVVGTKAFVNKEKAQWKNN